MAGTLRGGERAIDAGAKAQKSVLVGRAGLNECDIERQLAGAEEVLNFAQEDGGVVGAAFLNRLPDIRAEEHAVVTKMALVLRMRVPGLAERQHVKEFDVAELATACHQRIDQRRRSPTAFREPD